MKVLKSFPLAILLTILTFKTTVDAAPKAAPEAEADAEADPEAEADPLDTINVNIYMEGLGKEQQRPRPGVLKKGSTTASPPQFSRSSGFTAIPITRNPTFSPTTTTTFPPTTTTTIPPTTTTTISPTTTTTISPTTTTTISPTTTTTISPTTTTTISPTTTTTIPPTTTTTIPPTTTTTIPLTTTTTDACFEFNIHYIGFALTKGDGDGDNNFGATGSAKGCQNLCQMMRFEGCAWFNWNREEDECWLKTEKGTETKKVSGGVTGPRNCETGGTTLLPEPTTTWIDSPYQNHWPTLHGEAGEAGDEAGEAGEAGEEAGEAGEEDGEAGEAGEEDGEAGEVDGEAGEAGEAGEEDGEAGEEAGEAGEEAGGPEEAGKA